MHWLIVIVLVVLFRLIESVAGGSRQKQGAGRTRRELGRELRVRIEPDDFLTEDGQVLPVWKLVVSGAVAVPRPRYPVEFHVRLGDASEPTKDGQLMPVYSYLRECADENGLFLIEVETKIPHQVSSIDRLELAVIPAFALLGPRRGRRSFKLFVDVVDGRNENRVFQAGSTAIEFEQTQHGYLEFEQRTQEQEILIGRLALALGAADDSIDRSETAVIKRYLSERLDSREADPEHRRALSAQLVGTRRALQSGAMRAGDLIDSLCSAIAEYEAPDFNQEAYELCVQVVAADGRIDDSEHAHLRDIARRLDIPPGLVKEIHDRNFRIAMYGNQTSEALLDMPPGLDREEKLAFLNREYNRWRARATHDDEGVQEEATRRLELITKLRRELTRG